MRKLILIIPIFFSLTTKAATYWAAPSGSDTGPCVSSSGDPLGGYLSIGRAAECATVSPWVIMMKGNMGTYSGTQHNIDTSRRHLNSFSSGTTGQNIVQGVPNEPRPLITNNGGAGWILLYTGTARRNKITFRNFKVDGGDVPDQNMLLGGNDITVEDCEVANSRASNIFTLAQELLDARMIIRRCKIHHSGVTRGSGYSVYGIPRDSIFEDNEIYNAYGAGLQIQYDHSGAIVRNNYFHHIQNGFGGGSNTNQCHGMYVAGYKDHSDGSTRATGVKIYNNIFDMSSCPTTAQSTAISIYDTDGMIVANNVIYRPGQFGFSFVAYSQATINAKFINNIIFGAPLKIFENYDAGGGFATYSASYNACESSRDCGSNKTTISLITDCTVSTSDLHLRSGSVCVDRGTNVGLPFSGLAPDIGVELLSGASVPTKPKPPTGLKAQ
jgi:hypothetical protein